MFRRLRLFESLGNKFKVVDDVDVLGTLRLALSALDTFAGLTMALGDEVIV